LVVIDRDFNGSGHNPNKLVIAHRLEFKATAPSGGMKQTQKP
jgi:hypothetical protein